MSYFVLRDGTRIEKIIVSAVIVVFFLAIFQNKLQLPTVVFGVLFGVVFTLSCIRTILSISSMISSTISPAMQVAQEQSEIMKSKGMVVTGEKLHKEVHEEMSKKIEKEKQL